MKITKSYLKQIIKEELEYAISKKNNEIEEGWKQNLVKLAATVALFMPNTAKAGMFDDLLGNEPSIQKTESNVAAVIRIELKSPISSFSLRNTTITNLAKQKAKEQGLQYRGMKQPKSVDGSSTIFDVEFLK